MRLPFLQLESDLLAHGAGSVAVLLGCSDVEALGHIALMRAWAVSRASDEAAPDGWVPGDNAARLVASGARWRGEPMAFIAALADPGVALLEVHRDGIRVLGLEPYAEAWDKNAKARERLKRYRERNAYETRTFDARNANVSGQTQTQTQTQKETLFPEAAVAAPSPAKKAKGAKKGPMGDPRHAPLSAALVALGWPHHGGRTAKALKELLALADQVPGQAGASAQGEVMRRAARAKASTKFPLVREIHELAERWGHFAEPSTPSGSLLPKADDPDWVTV